MVHERPGIRFSPSTITSRRSWNSSIMARTGSPRPATPPSAARWRDAAGADTELRASRGDVGGIVPELVPLAQLDGHGVGSGEGGDRLVHGEAGVGIDDLVPFLAKGHDRVEHDRLGPGGDAAPVAGVAAPPGPAEEL